MDDLDFVTRLAQPLADVFGDHDGAVLPARAPEANRQVALALTDVVRQQINEQFGNALDELFALRERANVFRHPRLTPGQASKLGHEMRVGQEAHVKHQVGVVGNSVFESKADAGNQNRLPAFGSLFEAVGQVRTQLVNVEPGGINHQVGQGTNCVQVPTLRAQ